MKSVAEAVAQRQKQQQQLVVVVVVVVMPSAPAQLQLVAQLAMAAPHQTSRMTLRRLETQVEEGATTRCGPAPLTHQVEAGVEEPMQEQPRCFCCS
jgi:hypothetical protein